MLEIDSEPKIGLDKLAHQRTTTIFNNEDRKNNTSDLRALSEFQILPINC